MHFNGHMRTLKIVKRPDIESGNGERSLQYNISLFQSLPMKGKLKQKQYGTL